MKTCKVEGCVAPHIARGWCNRHYANWKRTGDPIPRLRPWSPRPATCTVEGCEQPCRARGYCSTHYQRWRVHGDPTVTTRAKAGPCLVEGCGATYQARGYCSTHYTRFMRHGDPLHVTPPPRMATPRYEGMHQRVQKLRTGKCSNEACSHTYRRTEMALIHGRGFLKNPDGVHAHLLYSNKIEDYIELCPRCHSLYDNHQLPLLMPLKWWKLSGSYASALVAAETVERAIELMGADHLWAPNGPWEHFGPEDDEGAPLPEQLPGPPSVEGVYHVYGE